MDDELLRRCQRGEESALESLVERFQERVFRLACRVLADQARAEDATADALAAVWSRCGSWRGREGAAAWIRQVAWRVILDHHRSRRRWWRFWDLERSGDVFISKEPAGLPALAERDALEQREQTVGVALQTLSAEERALVHWHYFESLSLADIAGILGVSREAVKMRLSRVRDKLRPMLKDTFEAIHDGGEPG